MKKKIGKQFRRKAAAPLPVKERRDPAALEEAPLPVPADDVPGEPASVPVVWKPSPPAGTLNARVCPHAVHCQGCIFNSILTQ